MSGSDGDRAALGQINLLADRQDEIGVRARALRDALKRGDRAQAKAQAEALLWINKSTGLLMLDWRHLALESFLERVARTGE
jgi:hypothetical protein